MAEANDEKKSAKRKLPPDQAALVQISRILNKLEPQVQERILQWLNASVREANEPAGGGSG